MKSARLLSTVCISLLFASSASSGLTGSVLRLGGKLGLVFVVINGALPPSYRLVNELSGGRLSKVKVLNWIEKISVNKLARDFGRGARKTFLTFFKNAKNGKCKKAFSSLLKDSKETLSSCKKSFLKGKKGRKESYNLGL